MKKIISYSFCDNFLERLVDDLVREYSQPGKDMRRLAIVFPGKRPALFLRRELSQRLGKSFYSPHFFSIDKFMRLIVSRQESFQATADLDQGYLIYQLAKQVAPEMMLGREDFAQFLPWAKEILRFIELLDLEQIDDKNLKNVEKSAQIGYGVPEEINRLLERIVKLRQSYHGDMLAKKNYSRGFQYLRASQLIEK